jgi:hypothetical protein
MQRIGPSERAGVPASSFRSMHIVVQKAGRIQNKSYLSLRGGKVSCFLEGRLTQKIYRRRADPAEADHMPEYLACLQPFDQSASDSAARAKHNGNTALGKTGI